MSSAAGAASVASGARSAPRLVYDFPGATCISVNDEVVHGIPSTRVRQGEFEYSGGWGGGLGDSPLILDASVVKLEQAADHLNYQFLTIFKFWPFWTPRAPKLTPKPIQKESVSKTVVVTPKVSPVGITQTHFATNKNIEVAPCQYSEWLPRRIRAFASVRLSAPGALLTHRRDPCSLCALQRAPKQCTRGVLHCDW